MNRLSVLLAVLFGFFQSFNLITTLAPEETIYYSAPKFSVKNTNVTFGVNRQQDQDYKNSLYALGGTLASVCQAQLINQKRANSSIDGIMNLVIQDYASVLNSGQEATMRILENSLYFASNGSKMNQEMNVDLAGFFGASNFGTAKINSLSSGQFGVPYISAGNSILNDPDNQFSGRFPALNNSFYQILTSLNYSTFNAVIETLLYFNWTLVASVYGANSYGYTRQQQVQEYANFNSFPYFACNFIFSLKSSFESIQKACTCVSEKSTINVFVLWMSSTEAIDLIRLARKACSGADKWTFIITYDVRSVAGYTDTDEFENSLLFRSFGPWGFNSFIHDCIENSTPALTDTLNELFYSYNEIAYRCVSKASEGLDVCPPNIADRSEACLCTFEEFEHDPYINIYYYISDAVNVFAEAISLIQNNCTYLTERSEVDFCALTEYTPAQLSAAMRFVNFTGYTGNIQFDPDLALTRLYKSAYLYNSIDNPITAKLVGIFNRTGYEIDAESIQFVDGKVPISMIVPQNPDLSYAVACVFFGISIIEIIVCLVLLVIFALNMDSRIVRQSGALLNVTMLVGTLMLSIAQLLTCLGNTDALCVLVLYFFRTGFMLLMSCLLLKNFRIYRIFGNKKATALNITELYLFGWVLLITGVYVGVITVFVAVFGFDAVLIQSTKDYFYQFIKCRIPFTTWNFIFEIFLEVTIVCLLVMTLILAWLTRRVHSDYSESKSLATFAGIVAIVLVILVPLSLTLGDESDSQIIRFVIQSEFILIIVVSSLGLLFIPKTIMIFRNR